MKEQEAEEPLKTEEALEDEKSSEAEDTPIAGTTMQLSETNEELIGIVKEYSGSDEVEILYLSPTESSLTNFG